MSDAEGAVREALIKRYWNVLAEAQQDRVGSEAHDVLRDLLALASQSSARPQAPASPVDGPPAFHIDRNVSSIVLNIEDAPPLPANASDDGVMFCPHCNPCTHNGNAKCRSPAAKDDARPQAPASPVAEKWQRVDCVCLARACRPNTRHDDHCPVLPLVGKWWLYWNQKEGKCIALDHKDPHCTPDFGWTETAPASPAPAAPPVALVEALREFVELDDLARAAARLFAKLNMPSSKQSDYEAYSDMTADLTRRRPLALAAARAALSHPAAEAPAAKVADALANAWERMDRARAILTGGNPRPECNWGMLDTTLDREALAASLPAAGRAE